VNMLKYKFEALRARQGHLRQALTFSEDTRTRLLEPKRAFGKIGKSVGALSDAIA